MLFICPYFCQLLLLLYCVAIECIAAFRNMSSTTKPDFFLPVYSTVCKPRHKIQKTCFSFILRTTVYRVQHYHSSLIICSTVQSRSFPTFVSCGLFPTAEILLSKSLATMSRYLLTEATAFRDFIFLTFYLMPGQLDIIPSVAERTRQCQPDSDNDNQRLLPQMNQEPHCRSRHRRPVVLPSTTAWTF